VDTCEWHRLQVRRRRHRHRRQLAVTTHLTSSHLRLHNNNNNNRNRKSLTVKKFAFGMNPPLFNRVMANARQAMLCANNVHNIQSTYK